MSKKPDSVNGSECLNYIDRDVGFGNHDYTIYGNMSIPALLRVNSPHIVGSESGKVLAMDAHPAISTTLLRWKHDRTKRKVGLVLGESPDGGIEVALLGNEELFNGNPNMHFYFVRLYLSGRYQYEQPQLSPDADYFLKTRKTGVLPPYANNGQVYVQLNTSTTSAVPYDETFDFVPTSDYYLSAQNLGTTWEYAHQPTTNRRYTLTNDKDNTLVFGVILDIQQDYDYHKFCFDDPLRVFSGNLYSALANMNFDGESIVLNHYSPLIDFDMIDSPFPKTQSITRTNLTSIPYNIILTKSEFAAKKYLTDGTLPPDAWLYPLDWTQFPQYEDEPNPDEIPDDFPEGNDPDDNERDVTPNLPQVPTYTPSMLSNYNWYWLQVGEYASFINWFWNDIGAWSDFGDFVQTIMGLYNDLASAILMVRYFPVDVSWIGGTGQQSKIIVGMVEQDNSLVDTISQTTPPPVRDIGHIKIDHRYKSFVDLTPYTQLSLYLPFYGFIDMDIDILMGHTLYIKGVYDYLAGTIQYFLYYDNQVLINSFLAKFAVDIPISLQTKNDRDNAIFSNVLGALGGAIGVAGGIASGNPVGMALGATQGVQSMMGASASAPLNVKGTVGETGALYAPPQCAIILRRPTIQSSDKGKSLTTWKHNIGQLCGYGYTLKNLQGAGFTTCHTPRIDFRSTVPMQQEIDEIYSYLESGVIL